VRHEILSALDLVPENTIPEDPDGIHAPWAAYSETYQPLIAGSGGPIRSLRGERWKLVLQEGGAPELYDLEADPNELTDVADARPDEGEALRALLEVKAGETSAATLELDEATRARLRALGYLDEE
jgi:arylsulfatase A-like enzyme